MTRVLRELPLTYLVPSERSWVCSASAVHERGSAGAPSSIAPTRPSARAIPSPRSPDSSTPRVRLHLKPGQKGTKQLLAQDQIVGIRVAFADVAARDRVKQAGGTWNPEQRVW